MVGELRLSGNTGIVDEDVDAREQRFGGCYAVRIRNIQRGDGADAAGRADLRRQRLQRLLPAGGDGHCGSSFRQPLGKMGAETAGRLGDESGLSSQIEQIAHMYSSGSSLQLQYQACGTIKSSGVGRGRVKGGVGGG